jgi:hypothetical protein
VNQEPAEVILQNQQETAGILVPLGWGGCQLTLPTQSFSRKSLNFLRVTRLTAF